MIYFKVLNSVLYYINVFELFIDQIHRIKYF